MVFRAVIENNFNSSSSTAKRLSGTGTAPSFHKEITEMINSIELSR